MDLNKIKESAKALAGLLVAAGSVAGTLVALPIIPPQIKPLLVLVAAVGTFLAVYVTPNKSTEQQIEKAGAVPAAKVSEVVREAVDTKLGEVADVVVPRARGVVQDILDAATTRLPKPARDMVSNAAGVASAAAGGIVDDILRRRR